MISSVNLGTSCSLFNHVFTYLHFVIVITGVLKLQLFSYVLISFASNDLFLSKYQILPAVLFLNISILYYFLSFIHYHINLMFSGTFIVHLLIGVFLVEGCTMKWVLALSLLFIISISVFIFIFFLAKLVTSPKFLYQYLTFYNWLTLSSPNYNLQIKLLFLNRHSDAQYIERYIL